VQSITGICFDKQQPNVHTELVGRPGLDPGTLGLKGTFKLLCVVGLVA
jgi:hypothetical protein